MSCGTAKQTAYCAPVSRRSRTSSCRAGSLSIDRLISRTVQGLGLRSRIVPSLATRTSPNPRGRNRCRIGLLPAGSVSVITTTSRRRRSSSRSSIKAICCLKRGSFGESAKMISGRATHMKSSSVTSSVAAIINGSGSSVAVCAKPVNGNSAIITKAKNCFMDPPVLSDIGGAGPNAKGQSAQKAKIGAVKAIIMPLVLWSGNRLHFIGGVSRLMDVILHIGAHRTGTTTFQTYLEDNRDHLNEIGTEFWGPNRTRSGLFSGLVKRPDKVNRDVQRRGDRANGLIRMELDRLAQVGLASLVVSEENMIGTMWDNLSTARLYGDAQARLDRFASGFGFHCKRVAISIRSYDKYWASVLAFMVQRGWKAPDDALLDRLVTQSRRWQDVIRDVAAVFPAAELVVFKN